ncbi:hypothetical protein GDO81_015294 [Engystomops pustulosus]|uniref:Uncharacterized protein n=1 Tax=Engystomops pustulosus TaxID=76066 RepID=A0AAV7AI76_ENGPU|nr:hypothetical protein GDO81_015294 [Engystomops pustulosus]
MLPHACLHTCSRPPAPMLPPACTHAPARLHTCSRPPAHMLPPACTHAPARLHTCSRPPAHMLPPASSNTTPRRPNTFSPPATSPPPGLHTCSPRMHTCSPALYNDSPHPAPDNCSRHLACQSPPQIMLPPAHMLPPHAMPFLGLRSPGCPVQHSPACLPAHAHAPCIRRTLSAPDSCAAFLPRRFTLATKNPCFFCSCHMLPTHAPARCTRSHAHTCSARLYTAPARLLHAPACRP